MKRFIHAIRRSPGYLVIASFVFALGVLLSPQTISTFANSYLIPPPPKFDPNSPDVIKAQGLTEVYKSPENIALAKSWRETKKTESPATLEVVVSRTHWDHINAPYAILCVQLPDTSDWFPIATKAIENGREHKAMSIVLIDGRSPDVAATTRRCFGIEFESSASQLKRASATIVVDRFEAEILNADETQIVDTRIVNGPWTIR